MLFVSPALRSRLQTMPYRLDESTGLIDYDMMEKTATLFRWGHAHGLCCVELCCVRLSSALR